jgi:hypothetical protein
VVGACCEPGDDPSKETSKGDEARNCPFTKKKKELENVRTECA